MSEEDELLEWLREEYRKARESDDGRRVPRSEVRPR